MTGFGCLLFDLDDTLIDESPNVRAGYHAAAQVAAGLCGVDADRFARVAPDAARDAWWEPEWLGPVTDRYGLSAWDGLSEQFPGAGRDLDRLRRWLPAYRAGAWRGAYARCGAVPAADDVRRTAITFASGRHRDPVRLTPGTARLLDRYSDRHLGIITNGPADGQVRKVRRAGLGALVHAVVASTAAGVGEPDPALVGMCLDLLGARDSRVLVIGDSLERDVQLAVNSGCPAVWIRGDQPGPVPDGVVAVPGPEDVADAITRLKAQ